MMTFYAVAADLVVAAHVAYMAFVVGGLAVVLAGAARGWGWVRNPWFRGVHLATILVVVAESWLGIACPLTVWEKRLRRISGQAAYGGDFVGRWLHDLLFFDLPPAAFTLAYTAFGLAVLAAFVFAPPRRPQLTSRSGP